MYACVPTKKLRVCILALNTCYILLFWSSPVQLNSSQVSDLEFSSATLAKSLKEAAADPDWLTLITKRQGMVCTDLCVLYHKTC